jgi:hypothetical protein
MKLNIFSIPVFISYIDSSKINLISDKINEKWMSETLTSFGNENKISKESIDYLLSVIAENLKDFFINIPFKIELQNIWQNIYKKDDFQENHIHANSHFSFVIYKEVEESKTLFFSPNHYLVECFYEKDFLMKFFETKFYPKLTKNQIIIFPSFLEHMVKKNKESITISGNIKINK